MYNYLDILAKNINQYLEKNYKRPAWLAEKSGVKAPNLSKILSKMGNPTLETIAALAEAMDLHVSDLTRPYADPKEFDLTIAARKKSALLRDLEQAEGALKRSLHPERPSTKSHPHVLRRELESIKQSIEQEEEKIASLRDQLGWVKKSEAPKEIQTANPTNPTTPGNRAELILRIQSRLTALDESQLGFVDGFIEDLEARASNAPAKGSVAK